MAKVYTAQEMREVASIYDDAGEDIVAAMLLQAADLIEHEEKREKKYEFAKKFANGEIFAIHLDNPIDTKSISLGIKVVRREVGEWEEVKK